MNKSDQVNRWIDEYSQRLLNQAYFLVSNKEDAEDLVQEVFIAACESYSSFKGEVSALSWLKGILVNKVAMFFRKKYRKVQFVSTYYFLDSLGEWQKKEYAGQTEEEILLDDTKFIMTFEQCIEKLPDKWKQPVKLYYLEDYSTDDVCEMMGISKTNLWKILQRSRLHLRSCLDLNWFDHQ